MGGETELFMATYWQLIDTSSSKGKVSEEGRYEGCPRGWDDSKGKEYQVNKDSVNCSMRIHHLLNINKLEVYEEVLQKGSTNY